MATCPLGLEYVHSDTLHSNKYAHKLITSFIAYYFLKEYDKIKDKLLMHREHDDMQKWIDTHYLYGQHVIPQPLIIGQTDIRLPKRVYIDYAFDEKLEVREDHGGMLVFGWLTEQDQIILLNKKIIRYNGIVNIHNIDLFTGWNVGRDWQNYMKYGNKWRFGFEKGRNGKPGLIYILNQINMQEIMNNYNYSVVTFKFDFRGFYKNKEIEEKDEENVILQFEYLRSYDIFGSALLWIDDVPNRFGFGVNELKFECTEEFLGRYLLNNKYMKIMAKWEQELSLGNVLDIELIQPLHQHQVQYVNVCVLKA